jgi:hypothetical protein
VLYYHNDPLRQLIREHTAQLAHEMRRARGPIFPESSRSRRRRLANLLPEWTGRLPSGEANHGPVYDS